MKKNSDRWVFSDYPLKKLIMETKIALLIIMVGVSNVFGMPSYSQTAKVSLDMENKSLEQVMDEIERQSEFYFIFNQNQIDVNRVVDIQANNKLITEILPELFRGTDVNYALFDRKILLTTDDITKEIKDLEAGFSQQQFIVSGTVTDASTGEAMTGVNILVRGTNIGAITDIDGKYTIPSSIDRNSVLVFSFIGYVAKEVPVEGNTVVNVELSAELKGLDEVVVIGYGTAKKASMTGSVAAVRGEQLQTAPSANFTNTLAGRLPGLVTVNYSGEPGADDPTIRVRGANTLGDNSALIVIDGVSGRDMTGLDPADIESISVLKDASAAIYGARAANGVILITTKRGLIGKPTITFNTNYGISMPTVIPKMADAATYATMLNEINYYDGVAPAYSDEEIQKYRDGSEPWLYPNTDWFAAVFKPSTPQTRTDVSIRGGTENMKYYISAGYNYQDAIYKNSSAGYSQYSFRSNIDGRISKNIALSFDISGRQEDRNFAANPFSYLINRSKPMFIAYYPGNKPAAGYQAGQSPVVLASDLLGYDKNKTYAFNSNVKLLVTVPWVKGLSFTGNMAFDKEIYNGKFWRTPYILYSWDRMTFDENNEPVVVGALDGPYTTPELTQNISDGQGVTLNALVNYDLSLSAKHNIRFLAGVEKLTGKSMDLSAFRRGFVSTAVDQMFAGGDPDKNNSGSASQNARLNYFGRVNYDYMQKYLLEFVWRYDGSYIFPKEGRYGFFPGVSAGWRISEEGFWKNNISFINYFKIRGSWGQTGNDRIAAYQYLSSYGFGSRPFIFNESLEVKTLNELRIANPNITWEVANQSNLGFDLQLFNGKIQFSAEYFHNLRTNILTYRNASVPVSTGLTLPRENIGKVANRGFEAELGYGTNFGNLRFDISVNGAYAKNEIIFWDESPGVPDYQRSTGQPMNAGLYYEAIGIFRDQASIDAYPHWNGTIPGDIIFKDVNNDTKIDGLDLMRYPKTELPTFTGGLSIDLSYKNFYASALFQGAAGAVRSYTLESGFQGDFLADDAEGRWTVDNPDAKKPRTWNTGGEYWTSGISGGTWGINNTYWLRNNDYLRLKNLQFGYNIPKNISNKLNLNELTVYFTGLNMLTITPLKSFDPETVGNVYPLSKVYNFGVRLTF